MKQVVVDASVVLKWFLPDEEYGEKALAILDRYIAEKLGLCAPSLLEYEIINGLVIAQRRGRINMETILPAIEGFLNLGIPMSGVESLYSRMMYFCQTFNLSAYDAAYVALAEQEKISLITADLRLYQSVTKKLNWVKWIGEVTF